MLLEKDGLEEDWTTDLGSFEANDMETVMPFALISEPKWVPRHQYILVWEHVRDGLRISGLLLQKQQRQQQQFCGEASIIHNTHYLCMCHTIAARLLFVWV
jgi:hypothetical protein